MHELSIAQAIVEIAERHAGSRRVVEVEVSVGRLRQVVPASLEFAFDVLTAGSALDGARLVSVEVPAAGRCRECGAESVLEGFPLCCAVCGSLEVEVVAGEELSVDALALEVEESFEDEPDGGAPVAGGPLVGGTAQGQSMTNERIGDGSHV